MDYGENKMKQTLVYQLDKPTQKKWETWQALTPITNEICNDSINEDTQKFIKAFQWNRFNEEIQ